MEKRYGAVGRQDGLYKIGRNKWELIYGFGKDNEDDETGWNNRQRFAYKPGLDEIKSLINSQIDADIDEETLSGMVWNDKPVRIDDEFQTNILGVLAVLGIKGDALFPKTFKLGNYADSSPAFHTFNTAMEFADFAEALMAHKEGAYQKGWAQKQALEESGWSAFVEPSTDESNG